MVIKKAEYIISCVKSEHYEQFKMPQFCFLGRSNVGKSSLINSLTLRKNLAYTSSKPGKTLTLNFYNINDNFYLVDVPGYGYASKSVSSRIDFGIMIEEYLSSSEYLKKCFLIIDSRHTPTNDDVLMYNYLKHFALNVCVIATKLDKLKRSEIEKSRQTIIKTLNLKCDDELILYSSITKIGREEVLSVISSLI